MGASTSPGSAGRLGEEARVVAEDETVQSLLDVLDDPDCRAIMAATDEESLIASELSEAIGLPQSTTYRKLDLLTETGILEEGTRISCGGSHATEYTRVVEDVRVSITGESGVELVVTRR